MKKIILASASPRRRELLEQLGLEFSIQVSNVDEDIKEYNSPEELVEKLSYIKAQDVAKCDRSCIIIGADTIVVHNGQILGKPADENDAEKMLQALKNQTHWVITGFTVLDTETGKYLTTHEKTIVNFKDYSTEEIHAYIATGEPMDKAGSYGIQGLGGVLVHSIEGCYFNVVGLPISKLADILKEFNIRVL